MLHGQIVIVLPFFLLFTGKRAPGSTDIPKDKDEKAESSNKSGMSAGVIAGIVGIVLGVIGFIVVIILIAVKLFKRERISKTTARTERQLQPHLYLYCICFFILTCLLTVCEHEPIVAS